MRLKKSHFGKPPLAECVLRHPTCQSELAELSESAIHPEGNAIHGLVEGTISEEMGGLVRGVSLLRAIVKKPAREVEKHILCQSAICRGRRG